MDLTFRQAHLSGHPTPVDLGLRNGKFAYGPASPHDVTQAHKLLECGGGGRNRSGPGSLHKRGLKTVSRPRPTLHR